MEHTTCTINVDSSHDNLLAAAQRYLARSKHDNGGYGRGDIEFSITFLAWDGKDYVVVDCDWKASDAEIEEDSVERPDPVRFMQKEYAGRACCENPEEPSESAQEVANTFQRYFMART